MAGQSIISSSQQGQGGGDGGGREGTENLNHTKREEPEAAANRPRLLRFVFLYFVLRALSLLLFVSLVGWVSVCFRGGTVQKMNETRKTNMACHLNRCIGG